MLRRTLDQRIRIEVDAPADCPPVLADAAQLESALLNIAINARDAMPDGGLLWFACREVPARSPDLPANSGGRGRRPHVAIAVGDTGSGMSRGGEERLRALLHHQGGRPRHRPRPATVYGFAKQSKGRSRWTAAGQGHDDHAVPAQRGAGAAASRRSLRAWQHCRRACVLLVEDDAEVRSVACSASSSRWLHGDAVRQRRTGTPRAAGPRRPDLLITDIALGPGNAAPSWRRTGARRLPGLPVLLMSGYASALLDSRARLGPAAQILHPRRASASAMAPRWRPRTEVTQAPPRPRRGASGGRHAALDEALERPRPWDLDLARPFSAKRITSVRARRDKARGSPSPASCRGSCRSRHASCAA